MRATLCSTKIYNNHFASCAIFSLTGNRHIATIQQQEEKLGKKEGKIPVAAGNSCATSFLWLPESCCSSSLMHFTPSSMIAGVKYPPRTPDPGPNGYGLAQSLPASPPSAICSSKRVDEREDMDVAGGWYIKDRRYKQRRWCPLR